MRRGVAGLAIMAAVMLSANAAMPQSLGSGHDTTQPIEISADNLEVRQDDGIAVFSGNVDAVQGTMRLRTDTLNVHYRQKGQGPAGDGLSAGTISRLDAIGNVFVSSPNETAQGETGVYDVDRKTIVLTGSVLLTQGKNVLRGNRLVMNLATGVSRIESARTTVGASGGGPSGGRVKAVIFPQKKPAAKN
jgi:lipopolysaccharide export system protein LptA